MKRAGLDLNLLGAVIPAVADGGAFHELVGVGVVGFLLAAVPVDDFAGVGDGEVAEETERQADR